MKFKKNFFVQAFVYLSLLYFSIYVITHWGHNFSVTLFLFQLLGILMLASLVVLCFKASILGSMLLLGFLFVSTLCFVIDLICFAVFDTPLTSVMIFTALETNLSEAFSFALIYQTKIISALLAFFALLLGLFFVRKIVFKKFNQNLSFKILNILALLGAPILGYQAYFFAKKQDCRFNHAFSFILPFRYTCEIYGAFEEISNAQKAFSKQMMLSSNVSAPPPTA